MGYEADLISKLSIEEEVLGRGMFPVQVRVDVARGESKEECNNDKEFSTENDEKESLEGIRFATLEYGKFKKMQGNRPLVERNVLNLMGSILSRNLLKNHPILVNKNFEVVDGQHRLEAAKRLNEIVYYEIVEEGDLTTVSLLNTATLKWGNKDYIERYCADNRPAYMQMKYLIDHYKIGSDIVCRLFKAKGKGRVSHKMGDAEALKADEFSAVCDRVKLVSEILEEVILYSGKKSICRTTLFFLSLYRFIENDWVDVVWLRKNLELKCELLRKCTRLSDYSDVLISIYNYRLRDKNKL